MIEMYRLIPAVDDHALLSHLEEGGRLKRPVRCPEVVYNIMLACWKEHPGQRPVIKSHFSVYKPK